MNSDNFSINSNYYEYYKSITKKKNERCIDAKDRQKKFDEIKNKIKSSKRKDSITNLVNEDFKKLNKTNKSKKSEKSKKNFDFKKIKTCLNDDTTYYDSSFKQKKNDVKRDNISSSDLLYIDNVIDDILIKIFEFNASNNLLLDFDCEQFNVESNLFRYLFFKHYISEKNLKNIMNFYNFSKCNYKTNYFFLSCLDLFSINQSITENVFLNSSKNSLNNSIDSLLFENDFILNFLSEDGCDYKKSIYYFLDYDINPVSIMMFDIYSNLFKLSSDCNKNKQMQNTEKKNQFSIDDYKSKYFISYSKNILDLKKILFINYLDSRHDLFTDDLSLNKKFNDYYLSAKNNSYNLINNKNNNVSDGNILNDLLKDLVSFYY
jgi:hypothetical protein